ncbi:hypothetical protein EC973_002814, partial [Apophysomyces ossiformis]
ELQKWQLEWQCVDENDADVQTGYFDFVFAGLGPLRIPKIPEQLKSFTGKSVHTAEWDPTIDFSGKRVAVVGSGARRAGRPDLIPVLTPKFVPGCKRIAKSEDYLEALAKPNVTVIPSAVENVEGTTIVDKLGQKNEVDILVLATGFDVGGFDSKLQRQKSK